MEIELDSPMMTSQQQLVSQQTVSFLSRQFLSYTIIMASSSKQRHKSGITAYLGPSAPLPLTDLPTLRNVLKQCQLLREGNVKARRNYKIPEMALEVTTLILGVWHRANAKLAKTPICIQEQSIAKRIEAKWELLTKIACKKGKVTVIRRERER